MKGINNHPKSTARITLSSPLLLLILLWRLVLLQLLDLGDRIQLHRGQVIDAQSVAASTALVDIARADHATLRDWSNRRTGSEGISTPTLSPELGTKELISASTTVSSTHVQRHRVRSQQSRVERANGLTIRNAAIILVTANVSWDLGTRPAGVVVQTQSASAATDLAGVSGTRHVTLALRSCGRTDCQHVAAETLSGPLSTEVWITAAERGTLLK